MKHSKDYDADDYDDYYDPDDDDDYDDDYDDPDDWDWRGFAYLYDAFVAPPTRLDLLRARLRFWRRWISDRIKGHRGDEIPF